MATNDFAVLLIRAIGVQMLLAGTVMGAVLLIGKLTDKPGSNLDNEYYVVTSSPAAIIATILCFVLAAVLIYGSSTFARWLSKGLQ
jgi:uncharacterized membrane protein YqgA involved in biofilm formation